MKYVGNVTTHIDTTVSNVCNELTTLVSDITSVNDTNVSTVTIENTLKERFGVSTFEIIELIVEIIGSVASVVSIPVVALWINRRVGNT